MSDLISRQAVLALPRNKVHGLYTYEVIEETINVKDIENLPCTQPEIIRCKDCKHHWTHKCMDSMPIERCDLEQTFYDSERDFCSLAERRTDG